MKKLTDLPNLVVGRHTATNRITTATFDMIQLCQEDGFKIIVGNNPKLDTRLKYVDREIIRISQVNSRYHGYSIRTIWAVK